MPTPEKYEIAEGLYDKGLSEEEVVNLMDLYDENGTLYAQTPIEIQRRYPAGITGLVQAFYDENPTRVRAQGEIRPDNKNWLLKKIDRIVDFTKKKKLPDETRREWQPDNKTIFNYPNRKRFPFSYTSFPNF